MPYDLLYSVYCVFLLGFLQILLRSLMVGQERRNSLAARHAASPDACTTARPSAAIDPLALLRVYDYK